jgi:hypothetical protein
MRSKSTLVLLVVFLALLAVVLFLKPKAKEGAEARLLDLKPDDIQKISLKKGAEDLVFERNDKGEWDIASPLAAKADTYEVNRLAEDLSSLKIEKVVEAQAADRDRAGYGIPQTVVSLWLKGKPQPTVLEVGSENPLDNTLYAQLQGDPRIVLLPSLIKGDLDKKLFDFRRKDVFAFETSQVATIGFQSKDAAWDAAAHGGEWYLEKPVAALARRSQVDGLLTTLSGLRAKDFTVEQRTAQDLKTYGFDKPDFKIDLTLLPAKAALSFLVRKKDDKVYVTTSAPGPIVTAEDQLLTDLDKKPDELREKRLDAINAWEVNGLELTRGALHLAVTRGKAGSWAFASGATGPADDAKVETFIRELSTLEAESFIDKPGPPSAYGLDKPRAEIKLETSTQEERTTRIDLLVGNEDAAAKQVVVKNARLAYLFRVGSAFLEQFPKEAKDWKKVEPPKEKRP